jgi:glycogen(starch) synthase
LLLSWEYPPVVVGGLGRHVHALAVALARAGHDVTVISRHQAGAAYDEERDGVRVVRVERDPPLVPFEQWLAWAMSFEHPLLRAALRVCEDWRPDVVHAHDWLVAHAAAGVKEVLGVPLVATVHATEAGRHQGWLPTEVNRAIHTVEWWLTYEARRVITCSGYMRWEVTRLFDLPPDSVDVVANGIDPSRWRADRTAVESVRSAYGDPLLCFIGRLEYEKGVQTLLRAMPRLRRRHPGVRLVIAGSGTHESELRTLARSLRLGRSAVFAGQLTGDELAALGAAADVALVPSIYEPFGMVALEAAAAGTPLVVADTGGLREFVDPGVTGLRFATEDVAGLADAVSALLRDEVLARRLAQRARTLVERDYGWPRVAARTAETYERAIREERALQAGLSARAERPLRIVVRDGNLLTGEG